MFNFIKKYFPTILSIGLFELLFFMLEDNFKSLNSTYSILKLILNVLIVLFICMEYRNKNTDVQYFILIKHNIFITFFSGLIFITLSSAYLSFFYKDYWKNGANEMFDLLNLAIGNEQKAKDNISFYLRFKIYLWLELLILILKGTIITSIVAIFIKGNSKLMP